MVCIGRKLSKVGVSLLVHPCKLQLTQNTACKSTAGGQLPERVQNLSCQKQDEVNVSQTT